jgi:hypothetical protein
VLFGAALVLWWLVLLGPLLDWVRFSSAVLLDAAGGFSAETSIVAQPGGIWIIQAPVPAAPAATASPVNGGRFRSLKLQVPQWIPTVQTVCVPLYWALILAAPRGRAWWRALILGTVLLLALAPVSLLVYAAHAVQRTLYPESAAFLRAVLDFADHICGSVLPYAAPVAMALALNRELRMKILGGDDMSFPNSPIQKY